MDNFAAACDTIISLTIVITNSPISFKLYEQQTEQRLDVFVERISVKKGQNL